MIDRSLYTTMETDTMRMQLVLLSLIINLSHIAIAVKAAEEKSGKAIPAREGKITTKDFLLYPPVFARQAKTLDPLELARESWKGWMSKRGVPWGMLPGGESTIRLSFDCRALPWPSIKQHSVDGPDNNMRAIGAHALLHEMLGPEKENDPIETGHMGYLLFCTDPDYGLPYSPDSVNRSCAIGHGEFAKNLIMLYEQTGTEWYKTWAHKALDTMRRFALVETWPEIGTIAWYPQGMITPGQLPATETGDPTMGGWLHLGLGWNLWAYAKWYELTGEVESLDFALALANRLMHSGDPEGNDGCFRPNGSFGGKSQASAASWHMHGHTHCLPGLLVLGEQLIKAGRRESGLQVIKQAKNTFDWLYDPQRNPDAGSMTGWLGEWLMVATGWERQADCEGCTMGDMVQAAVALGAASRLDDNPQNLVYYYDRAEQIFRGQLMEQTFRLKPAYLAVMKDCLKKKIEKESLNATVWQDQSPSENHAHFAQGLAEQSSVQFPHANDLSVIKFDGNDYFTVSNSAALRLAQFSVYAVLEVTAESGSYSYFSNYNNPINWGKGINLGINPNRSVYFFTTDGTEEHYDPMSSSDFVSEGYHIITTTYSELSKNIYADGVNIGTSVSKGLDYGTGTVAAIGALREFGSRFNGGIAELIIYDTVDKTQQQAVESYLSEKYGIEIPEETKSIDMGAPVLWLKAETGFQSDTPQTTPEEQERELNRRYQEALLTSERMVGQQLGACGFPDWVNALPSDLDPELPGIHMQGCCADATVRAAHAIWSETVSGHVKETRVNMAFNRTSPLVDVISCLPHRGEVNVIVKSAENVLVRVPGWAPKQNVKAYVQKKPIEVVWDGEYAVFEKVNQGQQLTVTYPLRIAEVKETPGSLDGTEYTEKWRGNTIVDITPSGKWIPMFERPELDTEIVPE